MSAAEYPENMSADSKTLTPPQKKRDSWGWAGVLTGAVIGNLIEWLTDWSWWVYGAPFGGIAVLILAYGWTKNRRMAAKAAVR